MNRSAQIMKFSVKGFFSKIDQILNGNLNLFMIGVPFNTDLFGQK